MSLVIDKEYDPLAWGSHLPALMACVASSGGPVLESGVGHFSTPALHAVCVSVQRRLVSVEKDETWRNKFASLFQHQFHSFLPSIDAVDDAGGWGVVFIDDSPGGKNRADQFIRFIRRALFVVVHDYHQDNEEAIAPLLNGFKFRVCTIYQPPTLVASISELPQGIDCL